MRSSRRPQFPVVVARNDTRQDPTQREWLVWLDDEAVLKLRCVAHDGERAMLVVVTTDCPAASVYSRFGKIVRRSHTNEQQRSRRKR